MRDNNCAVIEFCNARKSAGETGADSGKGIPAGISRDHGDAAGG